MVPIPTTKLIPWLDNLFKNYLCNKDGTARVKLHGFGLTTMKLLLRYPWYSVDSTSWMMTSNMGSIYVPLMVQGSEFRYGAGYLKVDFGNKISPSHFSKLSPYNQGVVRHYVKSHGFRMGSKRTPGVSNSWSCRERLNAVFMTGIEDELTNNPITFKYTKKGFF